MKVGWKTVMKQQKLVEKMTIEEKAAILSGKTVWQTREIDRLSIPSIFLSDGPHGIRKQAGAGDHLGLNASLNATCFPTAATIANSWNQDLGEEQSYNACAGILHKVKTIPKGAAEEVARKCIEINSCKYFGQAVPTGPKNHR